MPVLKTETMLLQVESDVVKVRHRARALAAELRFSVVDQTKLVTATSELARNAIVHGKGGAAVVEVVADQVGSITMFERLGFEGEALLKDHVRNRDGQLRDLLVLSHVVDGTWSSMAVTGIDEAVGGTV